MNAMSGGAKSDRSIATRWGNGPALLRSLSTDGYVAVPNVLLDSMGEFGEFGLNPAELVFLVQLMSFKWDERAPFPSYGTLASRMGVSEVYARKLAKQLEGKGLLVREANAGRTNSFDLSPLFQLLDRQAAEKQQPVDVGDAPF